MIKLSDCCELVNLRKEGTILSFIDQSGLLVDLSSILVVGLCMHETLVGEIVQLLAGRTFLSRTRAQHLVVHLAWTEFTFSILLEDLLTDFRLNTHV